MSIIPPEDHNPELRHVEKDVLIPKRMKEKAMVICSEYVKGINSSILS